MTVQIAVRYQRTDMQPQLVVEHHFRDDLNRVHEDRPHAKLVRMFGNKADVGRFRLLRVHHDTASARSASMRRRMARDLWSCAVTRHAFIGVYEGRFADAIPMLELSAHLAKDGDRQLSTRQWVDAVAAQAFAGMKDSVACENAIESAAAVQGMTGQIHNGGWLRFDGSRLHEERGSCYVQLGRVDEAESALLSALGGLSLSARRRGNVLTDLAMVGVQRREAEQVVSFGREALAIAEHTGSGVVGRRLQTLQLKLKPLLSDPAISQFNDDISALRSQTKIT